MAKKKSKGGAVTEIMGLALGAVVASKLKNMNLPIPGPPIVKALIPAAIGFFAMKKGSGIIKSAGAGMLAVGVPAAIGAVAPNLGINATAVEDMLSLNGAGDGDALAGMENTLAGLEEMNGGGFEEFDNISG